MRTSDILKPLLLLLLLCILFALIIGCESEKIDIDSSKSFHGENPHEDENKQEELNSKKETDNHEEASTHFEKDPLPIMSIDEWIAYFEENPEECEWYVGGSCP